MKPLILLELNELSPTLLERFMGEGQLPAFSRLHRESMVCVTDADEPQGKLNPWVQWPTVHTGLGFDEHQVFKLGEGASLSSPTVADRVTEAGGTVWLCGPMNVVPQRQVRGSWLPDPWNPDEGARPAEFAAYVQFVRANVQEHTNPAHRLSPGAYLRFAAFMARHGLSAATVGTTLRQLIGERTGRAHRWRRAALLDRFGWDLFEHVYRRDRPTFATYFSNTTAHYQHVFWRYMDPEPFELKPTPDEIATYGDAVPSGYREMDRLVDRAMALADRFGATVAFCTAISQQPYLLKEGEGGKHFYRPSDISGFVEQLGIEGVSNVAPVMSEQFHLYFPDEDAARAAETTLGSARVGDEPAFSTRRVGTDVFTGFAITRDLPGDAEIHVGATDRRVKVHDAMYRSETAKSGYHHPSGSFWVRGRGLPSGVVAEPVSLRAVAPTLLRLMGVDPASTMSTPAVPALTGTGS